MIPDSLTPEHTRGLWTVAVGVASAVPCALVGCYLVLRRMSLVGDAISHAVLPGIVLAYLLTGQLTGWPVVVGAGMLGLLTVSLTDAVRRTGVAQDASLGVVFTGLFALGVVLLSRFAGSADLDPGCVLYGLIEGTPFRTASVFGLRVPRTLLTLVPVLLLTVVFIALLWKELKVVSFDPALAVALGVPAGLVHYLLMAWTAGVTVAAFESVGSVLVVAMLVVPAATAQLLTDRLGTMLAVSALVATLSAALGYWWAVLANTSVAGMMAVAAGVQFALAALFGPQHGVASRWLRRRLLARRIAREDALKALYRAGEDRAAGGLSVADLRAAVPDLGGLGVWRLRQRGLARRGTDGVVRLTDAGRRRAARVVRAHRLWEAYLAERLELPLDHVHEPAERMEHFLGTQVLDELADELDRPASDPHGRPIPPG